MGESGYANSSWSASAGYSASMLTEDAKVDSSSTRQLLPSSVNISAEYPALPDHDSMNNPSIKCTANVIGPTTTITSKPFTALLMIRYIPRWVPIDFVFWT